MYFAAVVGEDALKVKNPFPFILFTEDNKTNVDLAKQVGFEAIELFTSHVDDLDLKALNEYCKQKEIRICNVGTILLSCEYGVNLINADESKAKEAQRMLVSLTKKAGEIGTPVSVGGFRGKLNGKTKEEFFDALHLALKPSIEVAKDYGTYISIEAINRFEIDWGFTAADIMEFMAYCGNATQLKVHYDTIHGHINERDQAAAIRMMGAENLGHLHFTDSDRWYPGHAQVDFERILEALLDIDYQGQVSFEYLPYPNAIDAAKNGLEYCKAILKKLEIKRI